jgi:hypothetical protein
VFKAKQAMEETNGAQSPFGRTLGTLYENSLDNLEPGEGFDDDDGDQKRTFQILFSSFVNVSLW